MVELYYKNLNELVKVESVTLSYVTPSGPGPCGGRVQLPEDERSAPDEIRFYSDLTWLKGVCKIRVTKWDEAVGYARFEGILTTVEDEFNAYLDEIKANRKKEQGVAPRCLKQFIIPHTDPDLREGIFDTHDMQMVAARCVLNDGVQSVAITKGETRDGSIRYTIDVEFERGK